ncbi:MAG TPA: YHS domain-containing protein [Burkholderiales bacterium]|nr:YHS domain-containing protein [Burkholderiales bacterium]
MEKDPVCGMQVDPTRATAKKMYDGKTYYFCSTSCLEKFEQAPRHYIAQRRTKYPDDEPGP